MINRAWIRRLWALQNETKGESMKPPRLPLSARLAYYAKFISKEGEHMEPPLDRLDDLLLEASAAMSERER
jgi:hypothetical protein